MSSEMYSTIRELGTPSSRAYPLRANLDYQLIGARDVSDRGRGQTRAMSGTRVWFESDKALQVGVLVELGVTWPVRLDNKIPLKLVIHGRTLRTDGKSAEVEILRYQFRTRALSSLEQESFRFANGAGSMPASA